MKQVIVIRKDLNMRKGKMVAQGAHASMMTILDRIYDSDLVKSGIKIFVPRPEMKEWLDGIFTKVVVGCDSREELLELRDKAFEAGLIHALVTDVGKTEFGGVPTDTALAIGPGPEDEIDKITGHLKLL